MTPGTYGPWPEEEVYGENVPTLPTESQPIRPAAVLAGAALFLFVVGCLLVIIAPFAQWAAEVVVAVIS
jgi:hypothetical protein